MPGLLHWAPLRPMFHLSTLWKTQVRPNSHRPLRSRRQPTTRGHNTRRAQIQPYMRPNTTVTKRQHEPQEADPANPTKKKGAPKEQTRDAKYFRRLITGRYCHCYQKPWQQNKFSRHSASRNRGRYLARGPKCECRKHQSGIWGPQKHFLAARKRIGKSSKTAK